MDGLHKFDHALLAATSNPARKLVTAVSDGASVLLISQGEVASCLRALGQLLGTARTRVLHVRPPLGLTDFMEQAASAFPAPGQNALERGFESLTELDADCDRIALLVEDAHLLPHPTLRYIEMALRASPHLQVVLAGKPPLADTLALAGFRSLGQHLSVRVDIRNPEPNPMPSPLAVVAHARRRSWRPAALAGALAASVALMAWSLQPVSVAPAVPTFAAADAVIEPASEPALPVASAEAPAVPAPIPVAEAAPILEPAVPVVVAEVPADALPEAVPTPAPVVEASAGPSVPSPEVAAPVAVAETPEERHVAPPVPPLRVPPPAPTLPPRQVAARPTPVRPERVASLAPAQSQRRCRDIVLRAQLGEAPDDGDRIFLRNGCR